MSADSFKTSDHYILKHLIESSGGGGKVMAYVQLTRGSCNK
jgi:hypothetical protein